MSGVIETVAQGRSRPRRAVAVAALLAGLAFAAGSCGGTGGGRAALVEVDHPDTATMAPVVREQIAARRAAVDAAGSDDRAAAGLAWGELGRVYHAYGFHLAAEACYRNARSLAPAEPRWAYLLGDLLQTTGQLDESAAAFAAARELGLDDLAVRVRLGTVLLDLGRTEPAAEAFRQALARDPQSAAAHYGAGRAAAAAGDHAAARDRFLRALELAPEEGVIRFALGASYRALGEEELARAELRRAVPGAVGFPDPEKGAIQELARGVSARMAAGTYRAATGDFAGAAAEFRRAIEAGPDDFQPRLVLGSALISLGGHTDEARAQLAAAVRLAPEDPSAWSTAGLQLARLGDLDEALRHQRRAVELAPGYGDAHLRLAQLLARRGEHAEAVVRFDEALKIDPLEVDARYGRGMSRLAQGRTAEAAADLQAVLAARPGDVAARTELAGLRDRGGDAAGAERLFRDALDLELGDRDRGWMLFRLGSLIGRRGDDAGAAAQFGRAVELVPDFAEARFNLGVALTNLGRYGEAVEQFRAVAAQDPRHAAARSGEAAALQHAGRYPEARAALEAGLVAAPDDRRLQGDLARLLASCPEPAVRDGARSVALAGPLLAAEGSLENAELMAMALAAAGRTAEAVELQQRVVAAAERAGHRAARAALPQLKANLDRYRQGRPCCA